MLFESKTQADDRRREEGTDDREKHKIAKKQKTGKISHAAS